MADWSQSGAWNFPGEDGGKERATAALAERETARREVRLFIRRLGILLCALGAMVVIGTIGFAVIEHVSPAYALATVAEFFVSGQLSGVLEERRIEKMISSFTDHYIVCGFGRVGRQVARDLRIAGAKFVVIDPNPVNREAALTTGAPLIESQPSDDVVLKQAGIERALGVIACVDSDAENIFIALTARELRSDIFIVARASAEDSEKKMLRAGADRVISPYKTSGAEMARVALRPQVGGAFQVADYRMEEIDVSPICEGVGKTIAEVGGPALIVAVRHPNGDLETSPPPQTVFEAGDLIIAMGAPTAVERLERIFQPPRVQSGIRPTIQGI